MNYDPDEDYSDDKPRKVNDQQWVLLICVAVFFACIWFLAYLYGQGNTYSMPSTIGH